MTMDFEKVPCPHCGHVQNLSLQPGQRLKCQACRTWFRVPKVREAARKELADGLAACQQAERDGEDRVDVNDLRLEVVVVALLSGLPRKMVVDVLIEHGISNCDAQLLLGAAAPHVRQGSRQAGIEMLIYGFALLIGGAAITGISYLVGNVFGGFILISVGAFAMGAIFVLLGLVKFLTGWNLH